MDENDQQQSQTPHSVIAIDDLVIVRDFLNDSNRFFETCLESQTHQHNDRERLQQLFDQSTQAKHVFNDKLNFLRKSDETDDSNIELSEQDENASYLDMSMRNYESYDLKQNSNPTEYVDVAGKLPTNHIDDDDDDDDDGNIYDNYIVENSEKSAIVKEINIRSEKSNCPFSGLPAAHLTIMQSPKIGWLTMHQRRKRFNLGVKRKYFAGLVVENRNLEQHFYKWWLLMYGGGSNDLKPTLCLPLYKFEIIYDPTKKDCQKISERNRLKFELKMKSKCKNPKSFCLTAESIEYCKQWLDLLQQLIKGKLYVENVGSAQMRKLPLLPLEMGVTDNSINDIDTVDTLTSVDNMARCTKDIFNGSEGIYEEPEEYYKNVPAKKMSTTKIAVNYSLPKKCPSKSTNATLERDEISLIYDIPKPTNRVAISKDADLAKNLIGSEPIEEQTVNRIKIDGDIRNKLATQLMEQSQKYLNSPNPSNVETVKSSTVTNTKYQLSTVRKWLFTNHLAKMRHSSNSTNSRKSGDSVKETFSHASSNQLHAPNTCNELKQKKQVFSVQPKGNKVHMIINQLEANGQLTLLGGGASSNKYNGLVMST